MKSMRPFLGLLGLLVLGLGVLPANAATPAFKVDPQASNGVSIIITVTFESVPQGFNWAALESSGVLDELIGVLPASQIDERGRPRAGTVPVLASLKPIHEGIYQDTVAVDEGHWAVVSWPLSSGFDPDRNPGAAGTSYIVVRQSNPIAAILIVGTLVLVGIVGVAWNVRTMHLSPQSS